jgi:hypothetical protein
VARPPKNPPDPKEAAIDKMKHRQLLATANQAISRSKRLVAGSRERFEKLSDDELRYLREVLAKARSESDRADREVERAKKNLETARELRKETAARRRRKNSKPDRGQ